MADVSISGAGAASSVNATDRIPASQGGVSRYITPAQIKTYVSGALGDATVTTINKYTLTAPATGATLTIANGKVLTISNTLTFTGTDSASVAFGGGGTVVYASGALGTPSSGTLTSCTGLPVAGITASTSTALGVGSVELGHSSDTTLSRSAAGKLAVEGVDVVSTAGNQNLTGGFTTTSYDLGTLSSGTTTLSAANGNIQHAVNGGAFTLAPQTGASTIQLDITNNASAGTITTSGFTKVSGSFTTTNTNAFRCVSSVGNAGSLLVIQAMQ